MGSKPRDSVGTRMRRQSKKRAAASRQNSSARKAFRAEFPKCMICQRKRSEDVHEIARGASRAKAESVRQTWLAVCRACHEELDDYSVWPISRQLAVKRRCDPEWYDREMVNLLRNRSPEAISEREVDEQARDMDS